MMSGFGFLSKQPKDFDGDLEAMYEYVLGVHSGIALYAVYKNGEQVVGIMERPLKRVVQELYEHYGLDTP